jgi:hypothetical protein
MNAFGHSMVSGGRDGDEHGCDLRWQSSRTYDLLPLSISTPREEPNRRWRTYVPVRGMANQSDEQFAANMRRDRSQRLEIIAGARRQRPDEEALSCGTADKLAEVLTSGRCILRELRLDREESLADDADRSGALVHWWDDVSDSACEDIE